MKNFFQFLLLMLPAIISAQGNGVGASASSFSSFISYQKTLERPADAMNRKEFTLQKQFAEKGLTWPARYVYIRSFKYDSQLEVWVKNDRKEAYKLFKTYKVCALAGTMGPKRMEGDYQVPEGFYYINEFNPNSTYHLSLGLNYPNLSDRILSDKESPGGEIYIHGSCVTVGCIPLTDPMIEELYIITAHAKDLGQDFIPVHIFPIRFDVKKSVDYLGKILKDDSVLRKFSLSMEDAFNYFEKHKQVPVVLISEKGEYIVNDPPAKTERFKDIATTPVLVVKKTYGPHTERIITDIPESVTQWPKYPGGGDAFIKYLEMLNKEMRDRLPAGTKKAYVQMEFIVDKDGTPVNFKIVRGGVNDDFNDELITKIEATMAKWEPAKSNEKSVAKKMVQTVSIEKLAPLELLPQ
jgi:murein L,D-transpeptidase YafK